MSILLAALPLLAAATPPAAAQIARQCRNPFETTVGRDVRPRKLGDLPSGRPWRAVFRLENGCPTPVAMEGPARP